MKKREKTRPFHFLILLLGLAVFSGLVLFIFFDLRASARVMPFERYVESLDRSIASSDFKEATRSLMEFEIVPAKARDWLRILKRARIVSERVGRPELAVRLAEKACEAFPGNETLRTLAVLSFIEAGNMEKAGLWAEAYLKSREYAGVKAEAFLRAGIVPRENAEGELTLAALPVSRDPAAFVKAGDLTGTAGFYFDAALLLLERGSFDDARALLSSHAFADSFPLACALAAYDSGAYHEAERILTFYKPSREDAAEKLLLLADVHVRTGKNTEAEAAYEKLRRDHPKASPLSYLNAAAILHAKDAWSERTVLEEGCLQFPANGELSLAAAKVYTAIGNRRMAEEILDRLELRESRSAASQTIRLLSLRDRFTPARFMGELWILRDTHPRDERLPKILAWLLLSTNDMPGISEILSRSNDSPWIALYRGITAYGARDYRNAFAAFDLAFRLRAGPEASFDRGLAAFEIGNYGEALSSFVHTKKLLSQPSKRNRILAEKSVIASALCLAAMNRGDEARKEIRALLSENEKNQDAIRILRKLEGRP